MAQNIQTFAGDVVVPGTLRANLVTIQDPIFELGSNNYVDKATNTGYIINRFDSNANVAFYFDETNEQLRLAYTSKSAADKHIVIDEVNDLEINVFGFVSAYGFRGDGGLLSNLVTDLQSVTEYGASSDREITLSNGLALHATIGNVLVGGNVTASTFFGDGANLTGIAATLEEIIINGNVTANVVELQNATSLITTGRVGVGNAAPHHLLSVGANVFVDDVASNVLTVEGNVRAHQLNLGSVEILPAYSLGQVTNISNATFQTLILSNAHTAFVTTAKAGFGIEPASADVGASGVHIDGHLRLGGAAGNTDDELMYIKSAGALGVLANHSGTNNTNTELRLQSGDTNNSNITMVGKSSAQYMTFGTNAAERMRITSAGNVGIGTTSTSYKLDVHGTSNVGALTATTGTFSSNLAVGTANLFVDTTTGNVGIGTTSPVATLDISSTTGLILRNTSYKTAVNDRIGYIEFFNGNTVDGNLSSAIEACVNVDGANNNSDLRFKTTLDYDNPLVERMRIDRAGNVGIGTNNPAYKLDVHGTSNVGALTATTGTFSGSLTATSRYLSDISAPYQDTIRNTSALAIGWYRIAENGDAVDSVSNGSRCSARFTIMDYKSSHHSTRTLYAGGTYGEKPFIHLLTNTSYLADGVISKVRVVEDGTYEGLAVEIYIDTAIGIGGARIVMDDNYQGTGFTLVNFESVVADHDGMNEYELDLNTIFGVHLSTPHPKTYV